MTVKCGKCNNKGHNSRTCKGQGGVKEKRGGVSKGKKVAAGKKKGKGKVK